MPRLLFVLAAVAAIAVAGCSSTDTKNDYVDTVNGIQTDVNSALTEATSGTGSSNSAIVDALRSSESALGDAVAELEEVDVPDEATESHPELIAAIEDLRNLVAQTAEEVEKGSGTEALEALTNLATKATQIDTKISEATTKINEDLGAE